MKKQEKQKEQRFYYMCCCPYEMNHMPTDFYAFTSYDDRKKWLEGHENNTYSAMTRKELEIYIGKSFDILDRVLYDVNNSLCAYQVVSRNDERNQWHKIIYSTYRPLF